ncbi:molybdate transport system substrate-binding protein [Noviherbaspirillum humi]|uniref:Molybdate transport system substrate-binding protein n=2 Tax=Noviherbaspirillum humi TaxID=1688639 RepID=A0A239IMN5_9BURK|nr:molybdate transport system substrate-binding protein [Noviherbaspirillum humi]
MSAALAAVACLGQAAEIRVLSAAAVQVPLTEVVARYEKESGDKVLVEYSTAGGVDAKLKEGYQADLVISDRQRLEALATQRVLPSGSPRTLGVVQIGVAVRAGGKRPDIASVEGFKASLLRADSVAYGDPPKGSTTGVHFAKLLQQMGIAEAIRPAAQLAPNGLAVMKLVDEGKAELGITQISEILHVSPGTLVGPLPQELQLKTSYAAAPGTGPEQEGAAKLLDALSSARAKEDFKHAGFD